MRLLRLDWWPSPMALAITATIAAAALVLYLQHRAVSAVRTQSGVIQRQLGEQTAQDVAAELRRLLDGPVFDTLTAVNHPELRAGRTDLVAPQFADGLREYPHVDRFFAWRAPAPGAAAPEVRFFGRDGVFTTDAALGPAIIELAQRFAPAQQIYIAAEGVGPRRDQQVFIRLFWTDARRVDYFAILGFVVVPARLGAQLFADARRPHFDALLARRGGDAALQLRVTDDRGHIVYGPDAAGPVGGRVEVPMLFYPPDDIQSRMAATVAPHSWTIEVTTPPVGGVLPQVAHEYGPTVLSGVLMLVALGLTMQAQRRSAQLARMQTEFVAHVSHQLKTPLSLLSAATETLQMDRVRSPERLAEYLGTIHAQAARLSLLVQRVLEFSRVQQRRTYEFERVDLGALVRETVDAFAHSLATQHYTFDVLPDDRGPYVQADPAALEQVLVNLLDNAVKFSNTTRAITVRVFAAGARAIVEISDHGVGIAPADQRRIFDRFYRVAGKANRPGFGLGLTIVRELVQAHRGRVEVVSALGRGSTFRVILPRHATRGSMPAEMAEVKAAS